MRQRPRNRLAHIEGMANKHPTDWPPCARRLARQVMVLRGWERVVRLVVAAIIMLALLVAIIDHARVRRVESQVVPDTIWHRRVLVQFGDTVRIVKEWTLDYEPRLVAPK